MSRSRHSSIVSLGVTHSASGISLVRVVDFISLAQCSKVYFFLKMGPKWTSPTKPSIIRAFRIPALTNIVIMYSKAEAPFPFSLS